MTGPIVGRFVLRCQSCAAQIYTSDTEPPDDQQGRLTRFADAECPRGGNAGGCPNTTAAVRERESLNSRPYAGVVTALTSTHAVVAVGDLDVSARRSDAPLVVGDTVTVQNVSGQWFITGGPF